jgi:hypothetical protein
MGTICRRYRSRIMTTIQLTLALIDLRSVRNLEEGIREVLRMAKNINFLDRSLQPRQILSLEKENLNMTKDKEI